LESYTYDLVCAVHSFEQQLWEWLDAAQEMQTW